MNDYQEDTTRAEQHLQILLEAKAYFFPLNRAEKACCVESHIANIVDSIPKTLDLNARGTGIARRCYLRGHAYDCREEYCEEAEDELSRAVKVLIGIL